MLILGSCQIEISSIRDFLYMRCTCYGETPETPYGFTVSAEISESDLENVLFRCSIIFRCLVEYCARTGQDAREAERAFSTFCDRTFVDFEIQYHWTG